VNRGKGGEKGGRGGEKGKGRGRLRHGFWGCTPLILLTVMGHSIGSLAGVYRPGAVEPTRQGR